VVKVLKFQNLQKDDESEKVKGFGIEISQLHKIV